MAWVLKLALALLGLASALELDDTSALVQLSEARSIELVEDMEEEEELWEEPRPLSMPADAEFYAFDRYTSGEIAEGRGKEGRWLPIFITGRGNGNSWNIHVSDQFPGYDLPNVPSNLVRKKLMDGLQDFYVDNSVLQHKGLGVKYRYSKDMHNKQDEFAPWGSLVTGTDEGDGWVKTASGYLPVEVHDTKVLTVRERKGKKVKMPEQFLEAIEAGMKQKEEEEHAKALAAQVMTPKKRPQKITCEAGEHVDMKTRGGQWYHARISRRSSVPDSYDVIVQVDTFSVYPVKNVPISRIRKTTGPPHVPMPNESPMCQRDGCITVRARHSDDEEELLHVSPRMGTDMLMRMACNRLKVQWDDCLARVTFMHNGEPVQTGKHVAEADFKDQDVLEVEVAAEPAGALLEDA